MTVNQIFSFLNSRFPVSDAMDFDNVGILIGNPKTEVKKALICLDCYSKTIEYAVKNQCQLIITHHPVIFSPIKNILSGSIAFEAVKNNISVISMHTNLDVGVGGINDRLCELLGLSEIAHVIAQDGYKLKSGVISPISAKNLAKRLKTALGGRIKFVDGGKPIKSILVCSGSGGNFINEAINFNVDALITADIKHHQFLQAVDCGISLFDAGHLETEDIIVEPLKDLLSENLKDTEFITFHPLILEYE